jgi:hypothetical protein
MAKEPHGDRNPVEKTRASALPMVHQSQAHGACYRTEGKHAQLTNYKTFLKLKSKPYFKSLKTNVLARHWSNPSYSEDHGSRLVQANSSQDPISKISRAKWTGGVAQVAEHLLCKCVAEFKPSSQQQKNY